jgi:hypothetical protein
MSDQGKDQKALNGLDALALYLIHSSADEARAFLHDEGLDVSKEEEYGRKAIKKLKFIAQAKANQVRNAELLEQAVSLMKEHLDKSVEMVGEALRNALGERAASFQFRNLDKWTDIQMRDVLNDVDVLQFMEALKKQGEARE